jgi:hypothetical protein
MVMRVVGECLINTGAVSNLPINAADVSDLYSIQFEVVQGTPAAGTTAVSVIPKNGTSEALLDEFGTAININPTALSGLKISDTPLKSITFTPSSWSAGVSIKATAWGRL